MPAIRNIEGLTNEQITLELAHGAKFVMYQYTISIILMTFKRSSDIYFVRANENVVLKGMPFTMVSFVMGWWGIPWGPIYTIGSLYSNFSGGKDVTQDVLQLMNTGMAKAA